MSIVPNPDTPIPTPGLPAPQPVNDVYIPATPVSPGVQVDDIPTITLPLTKATKSHIAAAIAVVSGAGQVAIQFLPDGVVKEYAAAGVGAVTVLAIWLGVYTVPNLPKITKR